jgi:hypothetical protein
VHLSVQGADTIAGAHVGALFNFTFIAGVVWVAITLEIDASTVKRAVRGTMNILTTDSCVIAFTSTERVFAIVVEYAFTVTVTVGRNTISFITSRATPSFHACAVTSRAVALTVTVAVVRAKYAGAVISVKLTTVA